MGKIALVEFTYARKFGQTAPTNYIQSVRIEIIEKNVTQIRVFMYPKLAEGFQNRGCVGDDSEAAVFVDTLTYNQQVENVSNDIRRCLNEDVVEVVLFCERDQNFIQHYLSNSLIDVRVLS